MCPPGGSPSAGWWIARWICRTRASRACRRSSDTRRSNASATRGVARTSRPRGASGSRVADVGTIAGIAFAGERGISKVEVSLDAGRTWHEATLKTALSTYTWRLWRFDPDPAQLRSRPTVVVRGYDGTGAIQAGN